MGRAVYGMGGDLEALRQRGEALDRALRDEAAVRDRAPGHSACVTTLRSNELDAQAQAATDVRNAKERATTEAIIASSKQLKASYLAAIDEACCTHTASAMRGV